MSLSATLVQESKSGFQKLVDALVNNLDPEQIFVHQNLLLLVLSATSEQTFRQSKSILDALCPQPETFVCKLIQASELERLLTEGQIHYSVVCRSENLIYNRLSAHAALPLTERLRKKTDEAFKQFSTGHQRSLSFIEGAAFYLARKEFDLSIFMMHQATEQCLRALLLSLTGQEMRTHSISELKQQVDKLIPALHSFFQKREIASARMLDRLDKAYSSSRYTDCFEITASDALAIYAEVIRLHETASAEFEKILTAYLHLPIDHQILSGIYEK